MKTLSLKREVEAIVTLFRMEKANFTLKVSIIRHFTSVKQKRKFAIYDFLDVPFVLILCHNMCAAVEMPAAKEST